MYGTDVIPLMETKYSFHKFPYSVSLLNGLLFNVHIYGEL